MEKPDNHYETLHIVERASPEIIRSAYRSLCQKWHPDKNPQSKDSAELMIRRLNSAYATLSDPLRRQKYDASLAERRLESPPAGFTQPRGASSTASRRAGGNPGRRTSSPPPMGARAATGPRKNSRDFDPRSATLVGKWRRAWQRRPLMRKSAMIAGLTYVVACAAIVAIAVSLLKGSDGMGLAVLGIAIGCILIGVLGRTLWTTLFKSRIR